MMKVKKLYSVYLLLVLVFGIFLVGAADDYKVDDDEKAKLEKGEPSPDLIKNLNSLSSTDKLQIIIFSTGK